MAKSDPYLEFAAIASAIEAAKDPLDQIAPDIVVHTFKTFATIERPTLISDGLGGQSRDWVPVDTVPFSLTKQSLWKETVIAAGQKSLSNWQGECPLASDIRPQDRLLIDETRYEVIDTSRGLSGAVVLTVYLTRISAV